MGRTVENTGPSCDPDTCSCRYCDNYTSRQTDTASRDDRPSLPLAALAAAGNDNATVNRQRQTLLNRLRASVLPDPNSLSTPTSTGSEPERDIVQRSPTRPEAATQRSVRRRSASLQSGSSPTVSNATSIVASSSRSTTSVSRSATTRTSPYRASRYPPEVSDYSSMLPPRLGTPIPSPERRSTAVLVETNTATSTTSPSTAPSQQAMTTLSQSNEISDAAALTSLGRRTMARTGDASGRFRYGIGTRWTDDIDNPFGYAALSRAHSAIEGSRIALTQARDAIRNALLHTERLERIAAILRRQAPSATPVTLDESMRHWDDERPEYGLERSLAELRNAGAELDRVIRAATVETGFVPSISRPRDVEPPLPPLPAWDAAPTDLFARDAALLGRPYVNSARLGQPVTSIRQPVPHRPGNLARSGVQSVSDLAFGQIHPNLVNARSDALSAAVRGRNEAVSPENGSVRELRQARPATLTQQVDAALAASSAEDSDESPLLPGQSGRNLRRRGRGGWRRLDANGDEIEVEDGMMFSSPTLTNSPSGGLGWRWRPASAIQALQDEEDEEKNGQFSSGWQPDDRRRSASSLDSSSSRPFRFQGNREMVGR